MPYLRSAPCSPPVRLRLLQTVPSTQHRALWYGCVHGVITCSWEAAVTLCLPTFVAVGPGHHPKVLTASAARQF